MSRRQLVGLIGRAIFSVDHDSGAAHVRDQYGTLHQIACRTFSGEIPRGREVLLVKYVAQGDHYLVEEMPAEFSPRSESQPSAPTTRIAQTQSEAEPSPVRERHKHTG